MMSASFKYIPTCSASWGVTHVAPDAAGLPSICGNSTCGAASAASAALGFRGICSRIRTTLLSGACADGVKGTLQKG